MTPVSTATAATAAGPAVQVELAHRRRTRRQRDMAEDAVLALVGLPKVTPMPKPPAPPVMRLSPMGLGVLHLLAFPFHQHHRGADGVAELRAPDGSAFAVAFDEDGGTLVVWPLEAGPDAAALYPDPMGHGGTIVRLPPMAELLVLNVLMEVIRTDHPFDFTPVELLFKRLRTGRDGEPMPAREGYRDPGIAALLEPVPARRA